jgi:hypothetical protein
VCVRLYLYLVMRFQNQGIPGDRIGLRDLELDLALAIVGTMESRSRDQVPVMNTDPVPVVILVLVPAASWDPVPGTGAG